jgi:hypothetical protein
VDQIIHGKNPGDANDFGIGGILVGTVTILILAFLWKLLRRRQFLGDSVIFTRRLGLSFTLIVSSCKCLSAQGFTGLRNLFFMVLLLKLLLFDKRIAAWFVEQLSHVLLLFINLSKRRMRL